MYQNNNKAIINKISNRSIKVNRMRNVFAIIAIALTTVLFTSLFTVGMSMVKSFEYSTMRQIGLSAHGVFKYLTEEQFEVLRKHKDIEEYGVNIVIGFAENAELAKRQVQIQYLDDNDAKYQFITPLVEGSMPKTESEIVLDTIVLDMMDLSRDLGQKITLNYSINGKPYSKEFTLSGYYKGDNISKSSIVCVSKELVDKTIAGIDLDASKKDGSFIGLINLNVMLNNKFDIENKLLKILYDSGFSTKDVLYGVNWGYMGGNLFSEPSNIIPIVGMLALIMLTGYLIVYNIFYVSVVKDIRFYGLLKTIGTTPKQLKKLIMKQAIKLSLIGIPMGLAIGYLIGRLLTPVVMNILTTTHLTISINPIIFIASSLFALVTVIISCLKPAKIASGISPVEAVRYTGIRQTVRKKVKNSVHGAKLHRMAFSNLFRNKGKIILAITSLSLSLILLNSVYTIVSGFDINTYLQTIAGSDFTIGDVSYYRWQFNHKESNALTPQIIDEVSTVEGVESIERIYYSNMNMYITKEMEDLIKGKLETVNNIYRQVLEYQLNKKIIPVDIYGVDSGIYELLNNYVTEGEINRDIIKNNDSVIIKKDSIIGDMYKVGDKISLSINDEENKEYTILAIVEDLPLYLYTGSTVVGGVSVYLPSDEFLNVVDTPSIMTALINVDNDNILNMEQYLKNKSQQIPSLDYRSRAIYEKEYKGMIMTFNSVGYTLSFIIGLIGILNFTNVMITGIISRRLEFATMQSIGMTTKQLRKMLSYEGLYYTFITTITAFAAGVPIAYFGVTAITRHMAFFTYKFTGLPIMLCVPVLSVIAVLIPIISFSSENKISIIERLRAIE